MPKTTVAIAVHNEEKSIKKVLKLWQEEPVDEILIISASTDSTDRIIKTIAAKDRRILHIKEQKKSGKPVAVNRLLDLATGDIIIMTDGDVFIEPGASETLKRPFKKKNIGIVAGHPVPYDTEGIPGLWLEMSCDILHDKRTRNIGLDVTGNLYAIRKGIIENIPENTTLDDAYVALETIKKGYKIIYEPEAIVHVRGARTISDYIAQKTRTRIGWWQLRKQHPQITDRKPEKELYYIKKTLKYMLTPTGIIAIPLYYILNFVAWINGYRIWKTKKEYLSSWKPIRSTKND